MRRAPVLLATVVAVAVLASCGSDGGSGGEADAGGGETAPPGVSLSRSEFIERAAAACREARADLEDDVARFLRVHRGKKPRPILYGDLARLVLLPAIEAEMEAIRALGVPPSELEPIEELLDEAEFTLNEVVYQQRIPSMEAVYRQFADASKMARAYGLPECINGGSVTGGRAAGRSS